MCGAPVSVDVPTLGDLEHTPVESHPASLGGTVRERRRANFVELRLYTDFDGTVARQDVTDAVLRQFAPSEWEAIEAAWSAGEIDAASCMRRQIALIEAPASALDALLDSVEIDPGFPHFVAWCEAEGIPLVVVSDGVDYFVRRILARYGFGRLPVFANRLVFAGEQYELRHPWLAPACRSGAGVCKCAIAANRGAARTRDCLVYVGDGRSDRCVSAHADVLFAKDGLASHCRERGRPYFPFDDFDDVREALVGLDRASERGDREWTT